jgi:hypothetical protein
MSGHLRFCYAALALLAGFSTSPASSNPIADLFSFTPKQPATPAAAEAEECLSRPGKSTAAGQRWVYRLEGHRRCWFQTAEETPVKRHVRRRAAKPRVAVSEENDAARKRRAVVDARAELLRPAPMETSQPTRPAPEPRVADASSVLATAIAAFVPPASVENLATDQPTPDRRTPRQVDVEKLLAAAPADRGAVAASVPAAAPAAFPIVAVADDGQGWMATWLGVLLMALGLISVLGSSISLSRTLREAVLLRD